MFERFWRAAESRTMPGSGLGLSIVAQVAERHSGQVEIDTSPAGGARLILTLPGRGIAGCVTDVRRRGSSHSRCRSWPPAVATTTGRHRPRRRRRRRCGTRATPSTRRASTGSSAPRPPRTPARRRRRRARSRRRPRATRSWTPTTCSSPRDSTRPGRPWAAPRPPPSPLRRCAGADDTRLVVDSDAQQLYVSGFVQNGDLIQTVDAVDPKPYDRRQVVGAVTWALGELSDARAGVGRQLTSRRGAAARPSSATRRTPRSRRTAR